jgi:activating signal cointegrator complex subunit 3
MNYISRETGNEIRMVGLSTALANGSDVATWFGVQPQYFFNFKPQVRPCPITIHFDGFSEKHYCPRMGTMNKPAYHAIKQHGSGKPVLIFVSSRRQTRLTSVDLISLIYSDTSNGGNFTQFLNCPSREIDLYREHIQDSDLKESLAYGIGMHHAGLATEDRKIVEELFLRNKIQILIATSTLAWGVNFPAHLVIVKGTEFFDPKTKKYVDFPVVDLLQMIGRAGRPQFDTFGVACVFVEASKKNFYRKYLNDPFPVESVPPPFFNNL